MPIRLNFIVGLAEPHLSDSEPWLPGSAMAGGLVRGCAGSSQLPLTPCPFICTRTLRVQGSLAATLLLDYTRAEDPPYAPASADQAFLFNKNSVSVSRQGRRRLVWAYLISLVNLFAISKMTTLSILTRAARPVEMHCMHPPWRGRLTSADPYVWVYASGI